jgi:cytochrome c biogenesis protein CcmG/thiol:disulfide interchange protein DsbE
MTARQQWIVVAAIVGVLAVGLGAASYFMRDDLFPVTIGSETPNFKAKVLKADTYKSFNADYKGNVVLLNVWATYCKPCIVEMPSLEKLYQAYKDSGLKMVAVSIDDAVSEDSVAAFARNLGVTFEILHDPTHEIEKVLQITGYPETFVIGKEGTIRKKWISSDDWSSQGNRALIAQLLGREIPKPLADGSR